MKRLAAFVLFVALTSVVWPDPLRFRYVEGEKYRIKTTVQEEVSLNGVFHHRAEILNKISVAVEQVRGSSGYLATDFQTSERRYGTDIPFAHTEYYESEFWRDDRGRYTIAPRFFMPVVRDVPVFPDKEMAPGDTWAADGSEVHDFRRSGIMEPLYFPITVSYRYLEGEVLDGRRIAVISIRYTVFHRMEGGRSIADFDPIRITGYSDQEYRFDVELGKPSSYVEEFDFIFHLASGDVVEYRGRSWGELVESPELDRQRVAEEIRAVIEKEKIRDVTVDVGDNGVTLTLDNIQFPPDSDYLMPGEREKIRKIGAIISEYDRDILIVGHTARVGTEESCQILSVDRARAVGELLLSIGAKADEQIVIRGMGSREPVEDNAREEGRRKNRRVEITILEN